MPAAGSSLRSLADERGSDRNFIYLLMLARKYGIEPVALHNALMKAKANKKSKCPPLTIELREIRNDAFCFMFLRDDRPVAQAPISDYSLAKLRVVPPELARLLNERDRRSNSEDSRQLERRIGDLTVGLRHVNLKGRIINKSVVRAVESRDGLPLVVCSATLSDGTGQIRLPLWNSQIHSVAKNDTVMIRGATVGYFRGELQLSVPRRTGSISIVHPSD